MAEKNIFRNSSKFCSLSKRRMFHIHQFVICLAEQLKPNGHFSCSAVLVQEKKKKRNKYAVIFKTSRQSENTSGGGGKSALITQLKASILVTSGSIFGVCEPGGEKRGSGSAAQVGLPSWIFIMSCQSFLSAQQLSSALIPPNLPHLSLPLSPLRHTPPTPCVVYHVRWNRVSPAVNLGNGVTSETLGTFALISTATLWKMMSISS